jgi:hemolysin type calcium-binding protein
MANWTAADVGRRVGPAVKWVGRPREPVARRRAVVLGTLLVAGCFALPAFAVDRVGGPGPDVLRGGSGNDGLTGKEGNDRMYGLAGNDVFVGGPGTDLFVGGPGADEVLARDGERDTVRCGKGRDHVVADARDRVSADCEDVSRQTQPGGASPPPPPPSPPPLGARQNPVPLGKSAALGDGWRVRVVSVTQDATAQILAASELNEPPAAGTQYVIVTLSATYGPSGSDTIVPTVRFGLLGESGAEYLARRNPCGIVPDKLPATEVLSGDTITGNICWQVRSSDVDALLLFDDKLFIEARRVWLRLTP